MARWLQVLLGHRNILLRLRTAAPFFDVSHTTVGQWCKLAELNGLLKRTKQYPKGVRQAAEFRFAVHCFPMLAQEMSIRWPDGGSVQKREK